MAAMNFTCFLTALAALAVCLTVARAETVPADASKTFDSFLACKADFFELIASGEADFRPKETKPYFDQTRQESGHLVRFSVPVSAYGVPLSAYIQLQSAHASGRTLTWGFRVDRSPSEVVKMIEARLAGARFAPMGTDALLQLEPTSTGGPADTSSSTKATFRALLVREADRPNHALVFCGSTEDGLAELKADPTTGVKQFPRVESLFVGPGTVRADRVLEVFSRCQPDFFASLAREKAAFGPVTVEPLRVTAPDGKTGEVIGSTVTFAKPIAAYGLHFAGYTQMLHLKDGKPFAYWWGFQATESPSGAALWLSMHAESLNTANRIGPSEWAFEARARAGANSAGSSDDGLAYRVFKIEASHVPKRTNVYCGASAEMMPGMSDFPRAEDLFIPAH